MRSPEKRCEQLYAEALTAGEAGDYSGAIKLLDEAVALIVEWKGSETHWRLAKYYLKLAKCLYMGSRVPGGLDFDDEEEGGEADESTADEDAGKDGGEDAAEGSTADESTTDGEDLRLGDGERVAPEPRLATGGAEGQGESLAGEAPAAPAQAGESDTSDSSPQEPSGEDSEAAGGEDPRDPFSIIADYLNTALTALENTPARLRHSRDVLVVEAEIYYVYGMIEVHFDEGDARSSLKAALSIYLELGEEYAFKVGECRYFLGKAHMASEEYDAAAIEFQASRNQLGAEEETLRAEIRAVKAEVAKGKSARFVILKQRRRKALHALKLRRNGLLDKLEVLKKQRADVEYLEAQCLKFLEPSDGCEGDCGCCQGGPGGQCACCDEESDEEYAEPVYKRLPEPAGATEGGAN